VSNPSIIYVPRPDATPEAELDTLASVYAFVLRCGEARRAEEKKNAAGVTSTDGDDTKGRSVDDFRAGTSIHG
jgi:hypothetical protein